MRGPSHSLTQSQDHWIPASAGMTNPGSLENARPETRDREALRACEKTIRLLRPPLAARDGSALREFRGHLARQTPLNSRTALCHERPETPSLRRLDFFTRSEDVRRASRARRLLAGLMGIGRGVARHEGAVQDVRAPCASIGARHAHLRVPMGARHAHPTCTAWCAARAHAMCRCRVASRPWPWCAAAADPVSFAPRGRPRRQGGSG